MSFGLEVMVRWVLSHNGDLIAVSLTASYDYHIGDFGLAPTIAVDFIDGHQAYVFGVALIRPF